MARGKHAAAAARRRENAESERIAQLDGQIRELKEALRLKTQEFEHAVSHRVKERVERTREANQKALDAADARTAAAKEKAHADLTRLAKLLTARMTPEQRKEMSWTWDDWLELMGMFGERVGQAWEELGFQEPLGRDGRRKLISKQKGINARMEGIERGRIGGARRCREFEG